MTTADLIVRLLRPEAPDKKFTQAEVDAINAIAASWELRSGVARRLVDFALSLVGHWPGGLGVAMVLTMGFFAAFCGSILAATSSSSCIK